MADANKIISIETKNITHVNGIEGKNILKMGNSPVSFAQIPAGLIVFLNDTNIPDGWSAFNSANDRMIIGAGNTYVVGATGGNQYSGNKVLNSTGNHAEQSHTYSQYTHGTYIGPPDVSGQLWFQGTQGAHAHTASLTYDVAKDKILLIKAIEDLSQFPINSIIPCKQSISGLSNISKNYLFASTELGSIAEVKTANLSSAGGHIHGVSVGSYGYNPAGSYTTSNAGGFGAHSPTAALTATPNIKRLLLSLWTNASNQFDPQQNMIGMWESLTAPDGWLICNGQNGTPDLRDSFINPVTSGSENITPQGNNTLNYSVSGSHSATHNHNNNTIKSRGTNTTFTFIGNYSWSHNHLGGAATPSWIPPYYALSFIMKAA